MAAEECMLGARQIKPHHPEIGQQTYQLSELRIFTITFTDYALPADHNHVQWTDPPPRACICAGCHRLVFLQTHHPHQIFSEDSRRLNPELDSYQPHTLHYPCTRALLSLEPLCLGYICQQCLSGSAQLDNLLQLI